MKIKLSEISMLNIWVCKHSNIKYGEKQYFGNIAMTYRNLGFTPVPRDVKSILPKIYLLSSLLSDCSQTRISIKISVIFIDGEKNSSNYKLPSSASNST